MPTFWLDANVYIRPHREGFYSFGLAPTFWQLLEQKANEGVIASPRQVYTELAGFGDNLADWVIARQNSSLFVDASQLVQESVTRVADYIMQNYRGHRAEEFLGGADPWVIAHAIADNGIVVTYETRRDLTAQTPKIPNVCQAFRVRCVTLYQMLQELGIVLEFKG